MRLPFRDTSFVIFALAALILSAGCNAHSHPSDQVLEQRFRAHEADFNKLVQMLNEDRDIVRLVGDSVFLSGDSHRSVATHRLTEYRRLFKAVGLESGIHRDGVNAVRLIASSKGLLIATSEKSYVYSSVEPSALVESVDEIIKRNRGDQSPVYKRLGGNWYLYYESW
jgi:hypothetical protein